MAHECPDCGQTCYCGGDIDDCLLNTDDDVIGCTHCNCKVCGNVLEFCDCEPEVIE